jgi:hypothetical protein
MNIPLNTDVWCADSLCGRSVEVMVNPATGVAVVRDLQPGQERLPPPQKPALQIMLQKVEVISFEHRLSNP